VSDLRERCPRGGAPRACSPPPESRHAASLTAAYGLGGRGGSQLFRRCGSDPPKKKKWLLEPLDSVDLVSAIRRKQMEAVFSCGFTSVSST